MLYAKQRNYCVSLLRETEKNVYANLKHEDIFDNKNFRRAVKSWTNLNREKELLR